MTLNLKYNNISNSFSKKELEIFERLNTPNKIQNFLDKIPFNFEKNGVDTIKSPIRVIRENNAHCLEGAIFACFILSRHKYKSYLLHLKTTKDDQDHVITVFKQGKFFGAISKTNHKVLSYRDPVYKNIRELAMSYFHEYFLQNGKKTLREYSELLDLSIFEDDWPIARHDLWGIDGELEKIKHYKIFPKNYEKFISKVDPFYTSILDEERHKK